MREIGTQIRKLVVDLLIERPQSSNVDLHTSTKNSRARLIRHGSSSRRNRRAAGRYDPFNIRSLDPASGAGAVKVAKIDAALPGQPSGKRRG